MKKFVPKNTDDNKQTQKIDTPKISEYMLNDPQFVNYQDNETQELIYEYVASDLLPGNKILDVGCGRGDLGHYLSLIGEYEYQGIDANNIAILAGNERYDLNLTNINLSEYSYDEKLDNVLSVMALDIDYGFKMELSSGEYYRQHLDQLLKFNSGLITVIIPLTDNDIQINYNLGEITNIMEEYRINSDLKYGIDCSSTLNIAKIIILK